MPALKPRQLRSLQRQKLAEAIEQHRIAATEYARIEGAIERVWNEKLLPADAAVVSSSAVLEELSADEAAIAAANFLGDRDDADKLQSARRTLDEAQSALKEARAIRDGLQARLSTASTARDQTRSNLDEALCDVVRGDPAMAALIERYRAAQREYSTVHRLLDSLVSFRPGHVFVPAVTYQMWGFPEPDKREVDAWKGAIDKLRSDASTPLPSGPIEPAPIEDAVA